MSNDMWKNRSSGMQCGTCIWFVEKQKDGPSAINDRIIGRCRKHAPTIGGFPVVYLQDWCGDHRIDENK